MSGAGPRRERERVVSRLVRMTVVRGTAANVIAVGLTATVTGVTVRAYLGDETSSVVTETNLRLLLPQFAIIVPTAWLIVRTLVRRRMAWFLEQRAPSPVEIVHFAARPRLLVFVVNLAVWTAAETSYLVYVIHVKHVSWPALALAKEIAANLFGFAMGTALGYLIVEPVFRPYLRTILPAEPAAWPRSTGLAPRVLIAWLTVAGAPLLLIAFTAVGLRAEQRGLVVPGLMVLSVLAAALGLAVFLIAGRTVTVPLRRLQSAVHRVAAGDLTPHVEISETAEIGHLEAGFNNMVDGLRSLQSDNAQLQDELRRQLEAVQASRVRIVEAADAERARIERNLHDGAQQRLLSLSFALRAAQRSARDETGNVEGTLQAALDELDGALAELRELARGIHPAILEDEGLGPALTSLAERAAVPVQLSVDLAERLPTAVEVTAYFVVAEALTNTARYADATKATIGAALDNGELHLRVHDDGKGGADPQQGSGLRGLADRVAALGGRFAVESDPTIGTTVCVRIPCH
jgi:signal transduction histidine kinase